MADIEVPTCSTIRALFNQGHVVCTYLSEMCLFGVAILSHKAKGPVDCSIILARKAQLAYSPKSVSHAFSLTRNYLIALY